MPIDPSIYSTIRPVAPIQTPSPLDLIGTVERVQSLREQTELRRLAGEKARQAAADDAQVRSVFAAHGDDVDAAIADLYKVNPRAAGPIKEQVEKTRKEHFAALTNEMDYKGKQLTHGLNLLPGMNEPTGYRAGRPMIAAMSPELDKFLSPEYDPETTPALLNQLNTIALSAKERLDLQQQGFKQLLGDKPIDGLSKLYRTAQNQEQWDNVGRGAVAVGTKSALLDQFGKTWSPEAVAHAASLGISSEKAAELEGQAAGRAQTAAHQATQEDLTRAGQAQTAAAQAANLKVAQGHLAVAQAAEARQEEEKKKGKLSPAQQEDIATMLTVEQLAQDVQTIDQQSGGLPGVGPLEGRFSPSLRGSGGATGEALRNKIGNIQGTIAKLRGGTSFTPNEQKLLETYTPTITDPDSVVRTKLATLRDFIKKKRENTLRVAAGDYTLPASAGGATTTPGGGSVKILSITPVP